MALDQIRIAMDQRSLYLTCFLPRSKELMYWCTGVHSEKLVYFTNHTQLDHIISLHMFAQ